jgi:hypothetical protein
MEGHAILLLEAARRLEEMAARSTPGDWRLGGALLVTRPEVIAHQPDGSTEHVAEARRRSAPWISAMSPAIAAPLAAVLRKAAADPPHEATLALAKVLLERGL